jgi:hypothetical protein
MIRRETQCPMSGATSARRIEPPLAVKSRIGADFRANHSLSQVQFGSSLSDYSCPAIVDGNSRCHLRSNVKRLPPCRRAFGFGSHFILAFSLPSRLTWPASNGAIVRCRCGRRRYAVCFGWCSRSASAWLSPKRKGRTVLWISSPATSLSIRSVSITFLFSFSSSLISKSRRFHNIVF